MNERGGRGCADGRVGPWTLERWAVAARVGPGTGCCVGGAGAGGLALGQRSVVDGVPGCGVRVSRGRGGAWPCPWGRSVRCGNGGPVVWWSPQGGPLIASAWPSARSCTRPAGLGRGFGVDGWPGHGCRRRPLPPGAGKGGHAGGKGSGKLPEPSKGDTEAAGAGQQRPHMVWVSKHFGRIQRSG